MGMLRMLRTLSAIRCHHFCACLRVVSSVVLILKSWSTSTCSRIHMRTCPQASFAQWLRVWRLISRKMGSSTPFPRPRPIDLAEPRSNKLRTRLPTQQERLLPTLLLQVRAEVTKLLKPSVAFGSDGTNGRLQQRQVAQHFSVGKPQLGILYLNGTCRRLQSLSKPHLPHRVGQQCRKRGRNEEGVAANEPLSVVILGRVANPVNDPDGR
mmetsp:Transcript_33805/g.79130  ORF Transcript_33805/g.79130 Transcript_33805/m.79130 type:complete len:210 (+) Transcript_33805:421-1050(+)